MWLGSSYSKKQKIIIWSPIIKYNGTVDEYHTMHITSKLLQIPEYDYNNFDNKNILFNIDIKWKQENFNNIIKYKSNSYLIVIIFIIIIILFIISLINYSGLLYN